MAMLLLASCALGSESLVPESLAGDSLDAAESFAADSLDAPDLEQDLERKPPKGFKLVGDAPDHLEAAELVRRAFCSKCYATPGGTRTRHVVDPDGLQFTLRDVCREPFRPAWDDAGPGDGQIGSLMYELCDPIVHGGAFPGTGTGHFLRSARATGTHGAAHDPC